MDRIKKFLKKLSVKERALIKLVIAQLHTNNVKKLDIKKLTGHSDIYRIRIKSTRIIFRKTDVGIEVLAISRRNEKTYKDF